MSVLVELSRTSKPTFSFLKVWLLSQKISGTCRSCPCLFIPAKVAASTKSRLSLRLYPDTKPVLAFSNSIAILHESLDWLISFCVWLLSASPFSLRGTMPLITSRKVSWHAAKPCSDAKLTASAMAMPNAAMIRPRSSSVFLMPWTLTFTLARASSRVFTVDTYVIILFLSRTVSKY